MCLELLKQESIIAIGGKLVWSLSNSILVALALALALAWPWTRGPLVYDSVSLKYRRLLRLGNAWKILRSKGDGSPKCHESRL
jgi:hypothetical protein